MFSMNGAAAPRCDKRTRRRDEAEQDSYDGSEDRNSLHGGYAAVVMFEAGGGMIMLFRFGR